MQVTVNFGFGTNDKPEIATRHIQRRNGKWVGWNSDRVRQAKAEIIKAHSGVRRAVTLAGMTTAKLAVALEELKGKRGTEAVAKRKVVRETLRGAMATEKTAKKDLERMTKIVDDIDRTHPEIVEFVGV